MTEYFVKWYSDFGGRYFIEKRVNGRSISDETWLFKNSDRFGPHPSNMNPRQILTKDMSYKTSREAIAKLKSFGFKLSDPEKMAVFSGNPTYCYKDLSHS